MLSKQTRPYQAGGVIPQLQGGGIILGTIYRCHLPFLTSPFNRSSPAPLPSHLAPPPARDGIWKVLVLSCAGLTVWFQSAEALPLAISSQRPVFKAPNGPKSLSGIAGGCGVEGIHTRYCRNLHCPSPKVKGGLFSSDCSVGGPHTQPAHATVQGHPG